MPNLDQYPYKYMILHMILQKHDEKVDARPYSQ